MFFFFLLCRGLEQLSPGCVALKIFYLFKSIQNIKAGVTTQVKKVSCGLHKQLLELPEFRCLAYLLQLVFACMPALTL